MDGAPSWLAEESASSRSPKAVAVSAASPSWSQEPPQYQPPQLPGQDLEKGPNPSPNYSPSPNGAPRPSEFTASPEEIKKMQKWHLVLRVLYMLSAILMSVGAVLSIAGAGVSTAPMSIQIKPSPVQ